MPNLFADKVPAKDVSVFSQPAKKSIFKTRETQKQKLQKEPTPPPQSGTIVSAAAGDDQETGKPKLNPRQLLEIMKSQATNNNDRF